MKDIAHTSDTIPGNKGMAWNVTNMITGSFKASSQDFENDKWRQQIQKFKDISTGTSDFVRWEQSQKCWDMLLKINEAYPKANLLKILYNFHIFCYQNLFQMDVRTRNKILDAIPLEKLRNQMLSTLSNLTKQDTVYLYEDDEPEEEEEEMEQEMEDHETSGVLTDDSQETFTDTFPETSLDTLPEKTSSTVHSNQEASIPDHLFAKKDPSMFITVVSPSASTNAGGGVDFGVAYNKIYGADEFVLSTKGKHLLSSSHHSLGSGFEEFIDSPRTDNGMSPEKPIRMVSKAKLSSLSIDVVDMTNNTDNIDGMDTRVLNVSMYMNPALSPLLTPSFPAHTSNLDDLIAPLSPATDSGESPVKNIRILALGNKGSFANKSHLSPTAYMRLGSPKSPLWNQDHRSFSMPLTP